MPAPDVNVVLDDEDEPQNPVNLGANPLCSNCMDELAGRGGILCPDCYRSLYEGVTREPELTLAEIALLVEHEKPWYSWRYYPNTWLDTTIE